MIEYDPQPVSAHGSASATVFFINEAPGPVEAYYGIPSVGAQGGNLYRALRKAGIRWACEAPAFTWPRKIQSHYKEPDKQQEKFDRRDEFLDIRKQFITCSNAYDRRPRSAKSRNDWVAPEAERVLGDDNLKRLRDEINPDTHRLLLICGEFAWLACTGRVLNNPARREGTKVEEELAVINSRLQAEFSSAWYMGHTRRWAMNYQRTINVLQEAANAAHWALREPCQ